MHIRMMHIQHPAKQQQDLESFFKLREEESFCDMTFITGGEFSNDKSERRCIKVHSLVIAASSDFLKSWMETTFVADLKVRILQIHRKERRTHIQIIYAASVMVLKCHFLLPYLNSTKFYCRIRITPIWKLSSIFFMASMSPFLNTN